MPIEAPVLRGDRVRIDDVDYYARPSGTATYLYPTADLSMRHARTVATYRLLRDGERLGDAPSPRRRRRVAEDDIRYLYVARDMALPETRRELKLGISSNLAATLRTYHRRLPTDVFVLVVECAGAARPLEQALLHEFAAARVDASEVLAVRMHELVKALRARGYVRGKDAIFRHRRRVNDD
jgi:hypothetical protein